MSVGEREIMGQRENSRRGRPGEQGLREVERESGSVRERIWERERLPGEGDPLCREVRGGDRDRGVVGRRNRTGER